ncbi:hypothetical protein [Streptomyces sp. NPDC059787]|uniref:hypothetical protein n=1 Tax=Streptomyces sp. NPDC059787 TaxID=3346947 RepID=UPI00364FA286
MRATYQRPCRSGPNARISRSRTDWSPYLPPVFEIVALPEPKSARFDFGDGGPEECVSAPMGDLITSHVSTGAPSIGVYVQTGLPLPIGLGLDALPDGPTAAEREVGRSKAVGRDGTVARALYEQVEERMPGRTWTLPEPALGFTDDAAYVGRLVLAAEGTWDIESDKDAELEHKPAACLWWSSVLADRLGIDAPRAFENTMDRIEAGPQRTSPEPASDLPGCEPSDPRGAEQTKSRRRADEEHEGTEHGVLRGE